MPSDKNFQEDSKQTLTQSNNIFFLQTKKMFTPFSSPSNAFFTFLYPVMHALKVAWNVFNIAKAVLFIIPTLLTSPIIGLPVLAVGIVLQTASLAVNLINLALSTTTLITRTAATLFHGLLKPFHHDDHKKRVDAEDDESLKRLVMTSPVNTRSAG